MIPFEAAVFIPDSLNELMSRMSCKSCIDVEDEP